MHMLLNAKDQPTPTAKPPANMDKSSTWKRASNDKFFSALDISFFFFIGEKNPEAEFDIIFFLESRVFSRGICLKPRDFTPLVSATAHEEFRRSVARVFSLCIKE